MCQSWFGRSHACFCRTRVPGRPPDIRPDGAPPTCRRLATGAEGRPSCSRRQGGADVRVIEHGAACASRSKRARDTSIESRSGDAAQPSPVVPGRPVIERVSASPTEYQPTPDTEQWAASCRTTRYRFCESVRYRAGHGRSRPVEAVGAGVPTTGLAARPPALCVFFFFFFSEWRVVSTHMRSQFRKEMWLDRVDGLTAA